MFQAMRSLIRSMVFIKIEKGVMYWEAVLHGCIVTDGAFHA